MTLGEYRVGIDFNPSNDDTVNRIKRQAADLIDLIETVSVPVGTEFFRLKDKAQEAVEDGAMWGVKAATKRPMPLPKE